jgi:hypothetical protein
MRLAKSMKAERNKKPGVSLKSKEKCVANQRNSMKTVISGVAIYLRKYQRHLAESWRNGG